MKRSKKTKLRCTRIMGRINRAALCSEDGLALAREDSGYIFGSPRGKILRTRPADVDLHAGAVDEVGAHIKDFTVDGLRRLDRLTWLPNKPVSPLILLARTI